MADFGVSERRLSAYNPRTLTLISFAMLRRLLASSALTFAALSPLEAQRAFRVEETTIAEVHAAMRNGGLTCRALVQAYLRRIDAYDKRGPAINAITVVNPDALATADSLDRRFAATRQLVGPLHCVPMIVKDNFQTIGLQTAAGNIALKGYAPSEDAFQVKRIKEAGAIVLAKSNMAEFAFSPVRDGELACCPATRGIRTRSIA